MDFIVLITREDLLFKAPDLRYPPMYKVDDTASSHLQPSALPCSAFLGGVDGTGRSLKS